MSSRWYAIVNPTSGNGRGLVDWPEINALLRNAGVEFDVHFTQRKFHATELAFDAIKRNYRQIIVIGGDGTLHEVVYGVMIQSFVASTEVTLAVVAVGVSNDWVRMYGLPKTYKESVDALVRRRTFLQDVGKVTYHQSRVQQVRYLSNVGGVGLDAAVCRGRNRLKSKGIKRKWRYLRSAFVEITRYKSRTVEITCDGKIVFDRKLLSATIGIGKYNGGGLAQIPFAVADDGLFDMTVVPKMSRVRLFSRIRALYTDNIYNVKGVQFYRGRKIEIRADNQDIPVELDGEMVGVVSCTFEIVEKAIKVVVSHREEEDRRDI